MTLSRLVTVAALLALVGIVGVKVWPSAAESARVIPAPIVDAAPGQATSEVAVIAGGCFWGVQGVFQHVEGVTSAVSGYAGGDKASADYAKVSGGRTKHAEAVRITYDPRKISYGRLLQIFFSVAHDPTELNRQGPDVGPQYRSTIFAANAEQAHIARAYIEQLDQAKLFGARIATTIEMEKPFYAAEAYHQDYLTLNPHQPYIVIHDLPKFANLKRLFVDTYRAEPALVSKTGM